MEDRDGGMRTETEDRDADHSALEVKRTADTVAMTTRLYSKFSIFLS